MRVGKEFCDWERVSWLEFLANLVEKVFCEMAVVGLMLLARRVEKVLYHFAEN
jgi:hypothetical protein